MTPPIDTKPKATGAPVDIATIKDDLGIPAGDTTHDAWLQRRIDGIWSRFQTYTGRPLLLASGWEDDWGRLITNHPAATEPPLWRAGESGTVFLRVFPVQSVSRLVLNGAQQDPTRLMVDGESGKLVGLDGCRSDLRTLLVRGAAVVEYQAGFSELPADLYEAMLGALVPLWASRQSSAAGGPAGMATRISAIDVGEVELSGVANAFVDASLKGVRTPDPLLGPYTALLDPYVDWRSMITGAYPTTNPVEASP